MLIRLPALFVALLVAGSATAQTRPSPFETREDAYRRQQSDRYQQDRNSTFGQPLGGYRERLGDSPVQPSQRELNQWNQQPSYGQPSQSNPFGQQNRRY
jgi:hypothetical protein